jgi:hypothetical protein
MASPSRADVQNATVLRVGNGVRAVAQEERVVGLVKQTRTRARNPRLYVASF